MKKSLNEDNEKCKCRREVNDERKFNKTTPK